MSDKKKIVEIYQENDQVKWKFENNVSLENQVAILRAVYDKQYKLMIKHEIMSELNKIKIVKPNEIKNLR